MYGLYNISVNNLVQFTQKIDKRCTNTVKMALNDRIEREVVGPIRQEHTESFESYYLCLHAGIHWLLYTRKPS